MNAIAGVALADIRESVRRFSFVVIVALAVLLGYAVLSEVFVLRLGDHRGVYNAAWIGTLMATTLGFFLSLAGFYLVRGGVQRDAATGVGEILAATQLRAGAYVAGKFVSNALVLLVVVAVLAAAALVMLLVHGEDRTFDAVHLFMPFLVFATPVALLVAAVAVLFDCIPSLRETAGNVVYFLAWMVALPFAGLELFGFASIVRSMTAALDALTGGYGGGIVLGTGGVELQTFAWSGFAWGAEVLPRLWFVGAALCLAAVAAVPFDRFDPSRRRPRGPRAPGRSASRDLDPKPPAEPMVVPRTPVVAAAPSGTGGVAMSRSSLAILARLLVAEVALLVKGRPLVWYLGAAGWIVACLVAPVDAVQRWLLPLAWLWPLQLWSEMGARETLHRTRELLFSAPAPVLRQLPAAWLAGVLLALLTGSGVLVRLPAEPSLLPGFVAGALFIPSLALLLGVLGGTGRTFQIVWMVLWYLGPMNGVPAFDLTGATAAGVALGAPWYYALAGLVLLGMAALARQHQVRPLRWLSAGSARSASR